MGAGDKDVMTIIISEVRMKNPLGQLMQQAQKMQESMKKAQDDLAKLEVTGQAAAGLVTVVMTGANDVRRVTIDPSLLQDDKEVLEELIAAAMNDAVHKVEQERQQRMSGLTTGLNLPPGFKMPF
jgi:DNA-binding YbaB/EbfC family protein